ncbi:MAG: hypothetical protein K8T90_01365 [Planctomycetes bacterium]|nr:hypothetical protein [Planctomycetota bacterium]
MKILTCPKCQSQFDVSSMQAGSNFVCGKCRNVLAVPDAAPVVQPTPVIQPVAAPAPQARRPAAPPPSSAPATVVLSPDEMRRALAAARGGAPEPAPTKAQPKLPPAMEARRAQAAQSSAASRAGGPSASQAPAPAAAPIPAARPAVARPAAAPAGRATPAPVAKSAAKAAAPAPAAPAGRSSRRARGGDDDEGDDRAAAAAKKKSQTLMYAGIGLGAVVVIAGAVMFLKKDKKPADTAGGATPANVAGGAAGTPAAAGPNAKPPVPANLDEWGKFLNMNEAEQMGFAATKRGEATGDASKLKALYDWFSDPRLSNNAVSRKTVAATIDDALRADANLEWANNAKGKKNVYELLRTARQECAKAFNYKEKDEDDVDAAMEKLEKDRWVDQKEFSKWETVVARIRERSKLFDSDPRLTKVEEKKGFIKANPLFKEFKFVYRWADPYLICQQYEVYTDPEEAHKNKERLANVNKFANRDAIIFTELNRHFRSLFAERFKLPELKEKSRILFAIVLWNHPSYVEFYKKSNNGETPADYIRAFYSPPEQKIFHYIGDDSMRSQDELPVANGRVQKGSDQVTFHEGTHQLQHEYGAIFKGKPLVDGDTAVSPRKSMWWEEGIAEFMGSVEVEASKKDDLVGATFAHNRLLLERLKDVRGDGRERNLREVARKWTIAELILPNHNGELLQKSSVFTPNNPSLGAVLFYGRGWGLTHFLWFYDNGKYRAQYLDYMEKVLKDEQGPEAFAKCMGRKNAKDWKGIEEEFEWYWDRLLARPIGWKDEAKSRPWNTETDPPTGKYDPNAKDEDEGK